MWSDRMTCRSERSDAYTLGVRTLRVDGTRSLKAPLAVLALFHGSPLPNCLFNNIRADTVSPINVFRTTPKMRLTISRGK